ncbi:rna-directed dna polymerase from mobile element jockey-like [Willisornis vidua]|uniref:Rna-directed dna polymerase from mobile element jockey-like n=1 Tax=Willisornis vidua TaxID=1566151 RepID=A0ABQ9D028_9PASS|nr:rna-directed dna polymerase from mobile element jockey-like [Willisornis vidua]
MSRWRIMMSGVPEGSVFGPLPFNIFTSDTDIEIKCTLSTFANDMSRAADTAEERDAISADLDKVEEWAHENLKFHKGKCKVLCVDRGNLRLQYRLGEELIESNLSKKDCT